MNNSAFYDKIAPYYHLIYADWEAGMARQAKAVDAIVRSTRVPVRQVLDVACGIGTQALGLAKLGYQVEGSDLSAVSVSRARREARKRSLKMRFSVADMTRLGRWHGRDFDLVMACDNAVPHLLTDADILRAFREAMRCLRPGGLYLITVRDYDSEDKSAVQFRPYGTRKTKAGTVTLFQTWRFKGRLYDVSLYAIEERPGKAPRTQVARSTYYAVGLGKLADLMHEAGFVGVKRVDKKFYQPVLLGRRP